jgi:hypothetical protein
MRLPLLTVLGVVTTLGMMTFDATDASALTRRPTVVSGERDAVIVKRPLRARGAVVVRRPLRERTAVIVKRPLAAARGAVVVKRPLRRGAVIMHND